MYVCLCNAISDKTIRHAVRHHQPQTLKELRQLLPLGTHCGKCLCVARQILQHELQQIPQYENIA